MTYELRSELPQRLRHSLGLSRCGSSLLNSKLMYSELVTQKNVINCLIIKLISTLSLFRGFQLFLVVLQNLPFFIKRQPGLSRPCTWVNSIQRGIDDHQNITDFIGVHFG